MKEYQKCMARVGEAVRNFPWEDQDCYKNWLAQTYYFVKHSVKLLGLSIARMPDGKEATISRFADHIKEEFGHEKMCLVDLKTLKSNISEWPELPATRFFYRNQYHGIDHVSPYYLMGYILFLEGLAVEHGSYIYEKVKNSHLGQNIFLKVHVEEDPDHLDKAFAQLDKLSESERKVVMESLSMSTSCYCQLLDGISSEHFQMLPEAASLY